MKLSHNHISPKSGLITQLISNMGVWFFAFFIFSIYFKADTRLAFVQEHIDITLLFLGLSVLVCIYRAINLENPFTLRISRGFIWSALLFLLLGALFIASLLYTQSIQYGLEKTMKFIFLTGWAFFGAAFLITDFLSLKRFSWAVVAISTAMAIEAIRSYEIGQVGCITVFGSDYIALGRAVGLGLLTIVAFLLPAEQNRWVRLGLWIMAILSLFAALAAGARGPFMALVISMTLFFLLSIHGFPQIKVDKFAFKLGVVALFASIILAVAFKELFPTLALRYQVLLTSVGDPSAAARLNFYQAAFDMFAESPIWGGGIGQFSVYVTGSDIRLYPHNIFLELAAELGLLGVLVFATLICISSINGLIYLYYRRKSFVIACRYLLVACCFALANAMVSGDINANRMLFVFIALLGAINRLENTCTGSLSCKSGMEDLRSREATQD